MTSYFYIDRNTNQQYGPLSSEELKRKGITQNTLVWCNGMADWTEAGKVPELSNLFYNGSSASATTSGASNTYTSNSYNNNSANIPEMRPVPKNWFIEAILVTVMCSPIFGVIAIIYANKVESRYYAGDYDGALSAAKSAKMWTLIGLFATVALILIVIIFYAAMFFFLIDSPDF